VHGFAQARGKSRVEMGDSERGYRRTPQHH
jgi:hypothetical protein